MGLRQRLEEVLLCCHLVRIRSSGLCWILSFDRPCHHGLGVTPAHNHTTTQCCSPARSWCHTRPHLPCCPSNGLPCTLLELPPHRCQALKRQGARNLLLLQLVFGVLACRPLRNA